MAQATTGAGTIFQRVLEEFKVDLTPEEKKEYSGTTLEELQKNIAAIQAKQRKTKTVQNMNRLQRFLEAMEAYSKILDVLVNVNEFAAFIWGPMKFLLLTASAFAEAFSGLLDAYKSIAESLPLLSQYQEQFGIDSRVECVLEMTFKDIFEFHRLALRYFHKPAWKQVFQATWKTFNTSVGTILQSLKQHRQLLADQAALDQFYRAQEHRELAAEQFRLQQRQETDRQRAHLLNWLSVEDVAVYQEKGAEAREANPTSGQWILSKDAFLAWYEQHTSEPLLWIYGRPGVGKSVLASRIVEEAKKIPDTTVLYFYFRQSDLERNSFVAMVRGFLLQLLTQHDGLVEHLYLASVQSAELKLKTQKLAGELLEKILPENGKNCIVVDGIDECPAVEQKHVVKTLRKYVDKSGIGPRATRCVFLSQYDDTTRPLLTDLPTLNFAPSDNGPDIVSYCKHRAREIQRLHGLDTGFANQLAADIARPADGMFLYARLMMDHLMGQNNQHDLFNEMKSRSYPINFDEAYYRILQNVLSPEPGSASRRRDALQVFELLVCAVRPLSWEEVQAALCIDVERQEVNLNRRRNADAKSLCGALIEIGPRGDIEFVHVTARAYVTHSGYYCRCAGWPDHLQSTHIRSPASHLRLAELCLEYFCFPIFDSSLSDEQIQGYLFTGAYALLEYAIVNWPIHVERGLLDQQVSRELVQQLEETLSAFLDTRWRPPHDKSLVPKGFISPLKVIKNTELQAKVLKTMASIHRLTTAHVLDVPACAAVDLFDFIYRLREQLEYLADSTYGDELEALERFYGPNIYKCPRPYCKWFHHGFEDAQERALHKDKHDRSFHCPDVSCYGATIGHTSKKELEAHIASYHAPEDEFPAEISPGRDSNGQPPEHSEPSSGPDQASVPANQEAGEPNGSLNQSGNTADPGKKKDRPEGEQTARVRKERRTTFQCNLCPKVFKRAYNLRSHLRTHTDERPFMCTVCGTAFAREQDRKRHEGLHAGEKRFVCQGTLKSGLQWGCGRRFARSDARERHFRSEAGRICIKPVQDEEAVMRLNEFSQGHQLQSAESTLESQPEVLEHHLGLPNMYVDDSIDRLAVNFDFTPAENPWDFEDGAFYADYQGRFETPSPQLTPVGPGSHSPGLA